MIDKVQKIKDWISKTQDCLMDDNGNFENTSGEGAFHILSNLDYYIDSLQEEPVSKGDFETALAEMVDKAQKCVVEPWVVAAQWKDCLIELAKNEEPVSEDLGEYINELSKQFPEVSFAKLSRIAVRVAKWQKEKLWKPADGDDLPIIDREVIALLDNGKVVFAHRPYKGKYICKNLTTGNIETFENNTYDKGGWNIPDVRFWLDVELPKEIEL